MKQRNFIIITLISLILFSLGCDQVKNTPDVSRSPDDAPVPPDEWPVITENLHWHLVGKNGINILPAWAITKGDEHISIGILDKGFLPKSEAFLECHNYDYHNFIGNSGKEFHGTTVTSLLSTCPKNSLGVVGVNNKSKVLWLESSTNSAADTFLILWLSGRNDCASKKYFDCGARITNPVDVINTSFAWFGVPDSDLKTAALLTASLVNNGDAKAVLRDGLYITKLPERKTIWVTTAGNSDDDAKTHFPSGIPAVITVGATTKNGTRARVSNWGKTVNIMAPGEDVFGASKDGTDVFTGTSFAAPLITGIISLLKSVDPELHWKTALYFLQSTARPMDCPAYCLDNQNCRNKCCAGNQQKCTPGLVDAGAAVTLADRMAKTAPKVALVDAHPYLVNLQSTSGGKLSASFFVFNVGGLAGKYSLLSKDSDLVINPPQIDIPATSKPQSVLMITVTTNNLASRFSSIQIVNKAPEKNGFTDEITVYVKY